MGRRQKSLKQGRWRAFALSVLLHSGIVAAAVYGWFSWKHQPPPVTTLAIEASVVDERQLKGVAPAPKPEPPPPEPAPEPEPEPVPEDLGPPKPDPAELERKQEEERVAQEKIEQEKLEQRKESAGTSAARSGETGSRQGGGRKGRGGESCRGQESAGKEESRRGRRGQECRRGEGAAGPAKRSCGACSSRRSAATPCAAARKQISGMQPSLRASHAPGSGHPRHSPASRVSCWSARFQAAK